MLLIAVVLLQSLLFADEVRGRVISWHSPPWHSEEIATMVRELLSLVPEDQAVGCDPYNSTAVLAHTGRPIVRQPILSVLLSQDEAVWWPIPGYESPWRSPEAIEDHRGLPTDSFR
tara:strand:- start:21070 stop:21417 length:348 start_codon:yes stop_codon:yes gene_type:complete